MPDSPINPTRREMQDSEESGDVCVICDMLIWNCQHGRAGEVADQEEDTYADEDDFLY